MPVKTYSLVRDNGDIFVLDSTTNITFSSSGKLSQHVLESGETVSDHYVNDNDTISFKGTISSLKRAGYREDPLSRNPQSYMEGLREIKRNKELFTLYHISDLSKTPNCLFTSLNFEQNTNRGITSNSSSVTIAFTAKQIRFGFITDIEAESEPESTAADILGKKVEAGPLSSVTDAPSISTSVDAVKNEFEKIKDKISNLDAEIVGLRAESFLKNTTKNKLKSLF